MKREFILSFAMSNYLIYGGGTNQAARSHQLLFNSAGISYICLAPFLLRGKKVDDLQEYWSTIIDGNQTGVLKTKNVISLLQRLFQDNCILKAVHVHHWKYIELCEFKKILEHAPSNVFMFIHDYMTICTNFTLLNNYNQFCGDGGIYEEKCNSCIFYQEAIIQKNSYEKIWNENYANIKFVFPSEVARNVWINAYPQYCNMCKIIPHQKLSGTFKGNKKANFTRLSIAFIGSREIYKGWEKFSTLYNTFKDDTRYQWYYLGTDKIEESGIKSVYVDNKRNSNAMVAALRTYEIDVSILWSLCKETYSYTYYECLASNTYVITGINSGNIAEQVLKNNNGLVLGNEKELIQLFRENRIRTQIEQFKENNCYGPECLVTNIDILNCVSTSETNKSDVKVKIWHSLSEKLLYMWEKFVHFIRQRK